MKIKDSLSMAHYQNGRTNRLGFYMDQPAAKTDFLPS